MRRLAPTAVYRAVTGRSGARRRGVSFLGALSGRTKKLCDLTTDRIRLSFTQPYGYEIDKQLLARWDVEVPA